MSDRLGGMEKGRAVMSEHDEETLRRELRSLIDELSPDFDAEVLEKMLEEVEG